MASVFPFDNSYARLPERFFARQPPTPVARPRLLKLNQSLAEELGLDVDKLSSSAGVEALAGNRVPEGADPLAQAYAGHQFGGFVPQLGDGRALLLGEVVDRHGVRRDIQLKGSGPTPFSRRGDGRAWLGPVLREYIVSEAMHALGVPTTRALAAVATGEPVVRETILPGAVLTRVARSHIRVGTFEYFAAREDVDGLRTLLGYVLERHYPEADGPLGFLAAVAEAQVDLVAQWMGLGFIHGVMNTDNTQVAGETIDYGPCAFLDEYHPYKVFSSIDQHGRYAYGRQPDILVWNLGRLASTLLPLVDDDDGRAIEAARGVLRGVPAAFRRAWLSVFRRKLGLAEERDPDFELVHGLLDVMAETGADFTRTFRGLGDGTAAAEVGATADFDAWSEAWRRRLEAEGASVEGRAEALAAVNPALIPRNHRIEEAIQAGLVDDLGPFERLVTALADPFTARPEVADLARAPAPHEVVGRTFCGT